ncbi:MAG TPA: di-heme oxidoredictase family protein [Polyangia bacterium]|nr:di-heme oxidoredictase family protein [Polyangia bacterium]
MIYDELMWPLRRGLARRRFAPVVLAGVALAGCSSDDPKVAPGVVSMPPSADAGPPVSDEEGEGTAPEMDLPLVGLSRADLDRFKKGDKLFDGVLTEADGLGPLYIRAACAACHREGGAGPGDVQKFQVVDPVTHAPIPNAPELAFGGTERPFAVAGATRPLLAPAPLAGHELVHSRRVGPTVLGRGYIEAVLDSEIERMAAEQAVRTDSIHGRVARVTYHSQAIPGVAVPHAPGEAVIGRFGLKARVATLDDFTADAFQGDMGLTSPLRPAELPNPDGLMDDLKTGVDLPDATVTTVAAYVRMLEIPARTGAASNAEIGAAAFAAADCAVCHAPNLKTRPDYPVPQLADIFAPLYSDLLLHDMGEELADRQTDEGAGPRDWRTAPLIGLRFQSAYLHDGRAGSVEAAILKHAGAGSEANGSVEKFKALPPDRRVALLAFVQGL